MKQATLAVHAGSDHNQYGTCNTPIYQSAAYVFKDAKQAQNRFALKEGGPIYSRITNPTQDALEARLAALFGGPALSVASGSAAVLYSIMNLCHAGDCVLAAKNVYGGTFDLFSYTLPNLGIKVHFFDPKILTIGGKLKELIKEYSPKLVFAEAIANPNAEVTDIFAMTQEAHECGVISIVDNTFAPLICQPFDFGVDVVVHSATKFICGNGSTMGGCIIENPSASWEQTYLAEEDPSYHGFVFSTIGVGAFVTRARCVMLRDTGACISPFNAWCLLNGLETLPLRMDKHTENASKVVQWLEKHNIKVNHGCLNNFYVYRNITDKMCSIFTIEVGNTREDAQKFCDSLKLFYQLANVGDAKSLVTHPATTTHSQLSDEELANVNITPTTVRLSIGIEDVDDIIEDLQQALKQI